MNPFCRKALSLLSLACLPLALGDLNDLNDWSGLAVDPDTQTARLNDAAEFSYTYPDGEQGWHRFGLYWQHDGSGNWRDQYGFRIDVYNPTDAVLTANATISTVPNLQGSEYVVDDFHSQVSIAGKGWHTATFTIDSFNWEKARPTILEAIKSIKIEPVSNNTNSSEIIFRNPELVKADRISLESEIRSESAHKGESVSYQLKLTNYTDVTQAVDLSRIMEGHEVMDTTISPSHLILPPRASDTSTITVTVSNRVASGGHEKQNILAVANGQKIGEIEYTTISYLEHPYIMHTQKRWDDILQKAQNVPWAHDAAQRYIDKAEAWEVPAIDINKISTNTHTPYLYEVGVDKEFFGACVAYKLTGKLKYAEKAALYLRQLSDPETGYPRTNQVNRNNLVKEGAMFQYIAMGYDIIYDSNALSDDDHAHIETTFRLFHKVINQHISSNTIGNWQVAELLGCIYTALAIQDFAVVDRFLEGPGGLYHQITNGVMSDGWWFECSIGYNAWVSREFTQLALALQPWGIDYLHASFPASYSNEYNILSAGVEKRKHNYYGMPFQKFGPVHKPYVKFTDMWDAMIPYIDYDGVMFAINDSTENRFDSIDYEVAYFAYRDPKYASIIKNASKRDLLYGVAELPQDTPTLGEGSAYSDNVGVAILRSKAEGKPARERIQAVLKYGTHGGYHGHFDRASLNNLMRYGRSFYNPEHIWYSYPNFMYKFFVQSSLPHNMVVVDMKQQEPVESDRILFAEGDSIQATAVETNARWSNPPYGGIYYDNFQMPLQDKAWLEGRYLPQPENEPKYGSTGEYSERVAQRRLLAVTDDYVVIADYLEAEEDEHTFDCLFNIKGFQGIESDKLKLTKNTESMNPNPILAAQFITDCDWYDAKGTTKVSFETQFGPNADNKGTRIYGQEGSLKMDVYSAWPKKKEVMLGLLPEAHWVNRKFWYSVKGDGKILSDGKFGAWVLGRDEIDVSLEGIKTLTLTSKAKFKMDAPPKDGFSRIPKTLFWADPIIVTASGKEIKLSELELSFDNIDHSPESGIDYRGGPIKIAGRKFTHSVPANPLVSMEDGTITLDLEGLNAVRFKSNVGGDYPVGDETWRRKSLSFRTQGKTAQYITVIEPFENESVIKSVKAKSANEVTVELKDGLKQVITINKLDQGKDIVVTMKEYTKGKLIKEETLQN